jgi:urease accessory protein
MDRNMPLRLLWLLQLSDSALPIGALNHSFGLETLVAEELLSAAGLEAFLRDYLREIAVVEILFCGAAYRLGSSDHGRFSVQAWLDLNVQFSAYKFARESRSASATLGRRLMQMVKRLTEESILNAATAAAQETETDIHHCTAFGLAGAALGIEEQATLLAYGHQSLANLISACQRLLPLGQTQATSMLWELKPLLVERVRRAQQNDFDIDDAVCFAPLVEMGSIRHPRLSTRLFIS